MKNQCFMGKWTSLPGLIQALALTFVLFPINLHSKEPLKPDKDLRRAYEARLQRPTQEELTKRTEKLKEAAAKLFIAIKEKDMKKILTLIDPEGGLASEKRHMVYYDAVKNEFDQKTSYYFQHLYGPNGVDEELTKLGSEIEIKVEYLYDDGWAGVTYEKVVPTKIRKPASRNSVTKTVSIIVENEEYHRPKLTFKWKNGQWYIMTLFE
ncbi:MAG: hypothetical protein BroJett040_00950 [Oligoflexia bacterium]|nr:MAG: hypothetical protein BroJett040_00950 [Oligoflexia bacterium]